MANWLSTTKNGVTETRTFDVTNALLSQQVDNQTTNLNYDLDGILKNDSKFHYVFDAFQRIVEVKDQNQNLVAKYQMDTSNRRISKTIGTTVHRTVYAGWQVAEEHETAPSGKKFKTTTKVYVYGQYIDEPLVMQITKPNGNQKKCGVEEDHPVTSAPPLPRWELLNTYALTNDNGKIVETYHYSAYGEVNIEDPNGSTLTESAYANTYFYTGRLLDSETNLYYFCNRYYNANQGRVISRDPLGYVDGMSLYRGYFVVNGLDALGLDKPNMYAQLEMDPSWGRERGKEQIATVTVKLIIDFSNCKIDSTEECCCTGDVLVKIYWKWLAIFRPANGDRPASIIAVRWVINYEAKAKEYGVVDTEQIEIVNSTGSTNAGYP